jgi:beta-N-acetylhexosaminidase
VKTSAGQHLFIGFHGTELTADTRQLLRAVQPAGVILFARNIVSASQVRALCRELPAGTILAVDQENRRVNRLRDIVGELPALADVTSPGEFGSEVGRCLRGLGIHLDFAPVLDLELFDARTDNALRGRCWGRTASEATARAGAFLDGLQRERVAGCAKHFPGLGGARCDSHEELPMIRRSRAALEEDLEPYRQLKSRLPAVMVSHAQYPAFDDKPASLSVRIMGSLLRRELGFDGLVISDDLEMGALRPFGSVGETAVAAVRAGADVVLVCHTQERILAAHEALSKARLPAVRVTESACRLEQFRRRWVLD